MSEAKDMKAVAKEGSASKTRWEKLSAKDIEFLWNCLKYSDVRPKPNFKLAGPKNLNMSVGGASNKLRDYTKTMAAEREAEGLPGWDEVSVKTPGKAKGAGTKRGLAGDDEVEDGSEGEEVSLPPKRAKVSKPATKSATASEEIATASEEAPKKRGRKPRAKKDNGEKSTEAKKDNGKEETATDDE